MLIFVVLFRRNARVFEMFFVIECFDGTPVLRELAENLLVWVAMTRYVGLGENHLAR